MDKFLTKNQKSIFVLADIFFIIASYIFSAMFLDVITDVYGTYYFTVTIAITCVFHGVAFECFGLYNIIWLYAGLNDYFKAIRVMAMEILALMLIFLKLTNVCSERMLLLAGIFSIGFIMFSRVVVRLFAISISNYYDKVNKRTKKNLLIIGAGSAARTIINDINKNIESPYKIIGLIDDNVNKIGRVISGYQVMGNRNAVPKIVKLNAVDEIVIAMPSAKEADRRSIIEICKTTNCITKIVPTIYKFDDIENGMFSKVRNVQIEDLLARDEIVLDNKIISSDVKGKIIFVTGGGGSIGSELCRQLAKLNPQKLIIIDIYENNAYDIQMELKADFPELDVEVLIASVRDKKRMEILFDRYRPYAVFHAAAHKHVPLMEDSPGEAVKNNVFGTYNVARCADKYGVDRFVLISTDKAVNPTNIMGASKRLCEMVVQAMQTVSRTKYVAVRFGNVLGSNGSVIPLFKKQIENGGPVTLTHKDITRFFMTIPEAVRLVLQSYSYAQGGEIFILDMGKPVKIYDLAVNLIKLSGLRPGEDIKIKITGLRPGEKLYEELLTEEEGLKKTAHSKIFIGQPTFSDYQTLEQNLKLLSDAIDSNNDENIRKIISDIVITYKPQDEEYAYMKKSYNTDGPRDAVTM